MPSVGRDGNFIFLQDIFDSFLKQHIKKENTFAKKKKEILLDYQKYTDDN